MIANSTWYLGGGNTISIYPDQAYAMERGNTTSPNTSDKVVRTLRTEVY